MGLLIPGSWVRAPHWALIFFLFQFLFDDHGQTVKYFLLFFVQLALRFCKGLERALSEVSGEIERVFKSAMEVCEFVHK